MSAANYWKEIYLAKCKDLDITPTAARENRFLAVIKQHCAGDSFNLNEHGLGENAAKAIGKALKNEKRFTTLNLSGNTFRDAGAAAIAELIKSNKLIISLDLRSNDIGEKGGRALAQAIGGQIERDNEGAENSTPALSTMTSSLSLPLSTSLLPSPSSLSSPLSPPSLLSSSLTSLDLSALQGSSRNHLGPKGAYALAQALSTNSSLTKLMLADNGLGNEGMQNLINGLHANSSLVHLDLSSNNIDEVGCEVLCDALSASSRSECKVEHLYLARNNICDLGMTSIAKLVQNNTKLKTLDISSCGIGPKGAKILTEGLRYNGSLKTLHLDRNKLSSPGVSSIAFALQQRITSIETVTFSNNEITWKGCQEISELINKSTTLTKLDLSYNEIGEKGVEFIAETLKWNKSVMYLDISSNKILDQGGKAVASMLAVNTALQHLNVRDNAMRDGAGSAFASNLRTNETLLTINVDMNDFNFQNFSAIMDKLKENKKKYKRGLISRHKKNIEMLKMEETKLINMNVELVEKTEQRVKAETMAHDAIANMEKVEANSQQYTKQLEESLEEARRQIVQTTNKSQATSSHTATVKSDKDQRYRNILAKVHKEKDTNRKLQMKLKHLTSLLNDAKIASEREVDELTNRLKIDLMDKRQSELDLKSSVQRYSELKGDSDPPLPLSRLSHISPQDRKRSQRDLQKDVQK